MSHGKEETGTAACSGVFRWSTGVIPVFLGRNRSAETLFASTGVKDEEEELSNGQTEKTRLEIHGLPPIGLGKQGVGKVDEQAWPLLPGSCEIRAESSSAWVSRAKALKFKLGDSDWPSLNDDLQCNQSSSKNIKNSSGGISRGGLNLLERNATAAAAGGSGSSDERGHILTQQNRQQILQRRGEEDLPEAALDDEQHEFPRLVRSIQKRTAGCKGWMRLPPIVMPREPEEQQQQQKRSRQAAFDHTPPKLRNGGAGCSATNLPPVYLMLNKDFVVISPLKENLLLTLALTHKKDPASPTSDGEFPEQEAIAAVAAADVDDDDDGDDNIVGEADSSSAAASASTAAAASEKRIRRHVYVGRFEAFSSFVRFGLGRDAKRVATESNAGGTSTISESLSVEYFVRKFQAKDVVTEMEVEYCAMNWKKVDYICSLYDQRVGVSVTRAMSYPNPHDFSPQMAYRLLYKKLFGLVVARHGVTDRHSFSQCILHVWCETTTTAKLLEAQYKGVSEELDITDDVIMVLTVAEGWHARPIFYESCLER